MAGASQLELSRSTSRPAPTATSGSSARAPSSSGASRPTARSRTSRTGITPGSDLSSITAGPDGALWFTGKADPGRIGRITTDGVVTEFTAGLHAEHGPERHHRRTRRQALVHRERRPRRHRPHHARAARSPSSTTASRTTPGRSASRRARTARSGSRSRRAPARSAASRRTAHITEHTAGMTSGIPPWLITAGPRRQHVVHAERESRRHRAHHRAARREGPQRAARGLHDGESPGEDPRRTRRTPTTTSSTAPPRSSAARRRPRTRATAGRRSTSARTVAGLTPGHHLLLPPRRDERRRARRSATCGRSTRRARAAEGGGTTTDSETKPEFAELVVAEAQEGTIRFKPPGARRWRRLTSDAELPGRRDRRHPARQHRDHERGSRRRAPDRPLQRRRLLAPSAAPGARARGPSPSRRRLLWLQAPGAPCAPRHQRAARRRITRVRRLWGRDRGGRYRTYGRHSHATVRGTRWLTEDRCLGTYTRVTEGVGRRTRLGAPP